MAIVPTVFRLEWPEEVRALVITDDNPGGKITNSDLECAGGLLLWLVIEQVVPCLNNKHVGLLNDNSPTISWLKRMNSRHSKTAAALIRTLAMRLRLAKASPIIPMHIPGVENAISDIPSRSFGRKVKWHCKTDADFLTMFNTIFPLPSKNSWSVYQVPKKVSMKVISILLTQASELHEWSRPQRPRTSISQPGVPMRNLWEWHPYLPQVDVPLRRANQSDIRIWSKSQDRILRPPSRDWRFVSQYGSLSRWPDDIHGQEVQPTQDEWVGQAPPAASVDDVRLQEVGQAS